MRKILCDYCWDIVCWDGCQGRHILCFFQDILIWIPLNGPIENRPSADMLIQYLLLDLGKDIDWWNHLTKKGNKALSNTMSIVNARKLPNSEQTILCDENHLWSKHFTKIIAVDSSNVLIWIQFEYKLFFFYNGLLWQPNNWKALKPSLMCCEILNFKQKFLQKVSHI